MEMGTYLRFMLALVFVLGLILMAAWAAKRFGMGMAAKGARGRRRRITLVEVMPLDGKRRLVLIRRDDREHLLLVGGAADLVVEHDIAMPVFSLPEPGPKTGPGTKEGEAR